MVADSTAHEEATASPTEEQPSNTEEVETREQECPQPPYPLHESVRDRLDPQYVAFYNEHLLNAQQVHYQPVSASRAGGGKLIPGGTDPVPMSQVIDMWLPRKESTGPDVPIRIFVPKGDPPSSAGWPLFLWYHGGGWVLGNIDSENSLCTNLADRARCVVVTTDYRLAPENPFPAAVEDAFETALWAVGCGPSDARQVCFAADAPLDLSKLSIGGSSAGGNLAAVVTQRAILHEAFDEDDGPIFMFQLLVVPVTDNTASLARSPSYADVEHTAPLPVAKMMWYRRHYLPREEDWSSVDASPLLAPKEVFARLPPALVVVAGMDVLRWEGKEYAWKLGEAGVHAEVEEIEGAPHVFIVMDAVLDIGKYGVDFVCRRLKEALGT